MAQRTQVILVDDLTGDVLPDGQGQTVSFGLDGANYEIDLNKDNADTLRGDLKRYVDAARKVGRATATKPRTARGTSSSGVDLAAVRTWARENGHEVSERGRVAASVLEAYEAAH